MNSRSQELQLHEARAIAADPVLQRRLRKSYEVGRHVLSFILSFLTFFIIFFKLMLHFYGMKLKDAATGELERGENYRNRYRHLNSSFHNYLRITRILKCLGECGFEHYKWPFLRHVLHEIYVEHQLQNCKRSCLQFWSQVLRNPADQDEMRRVVSQYDPLALEKAPPPNPVFKSAFDDDDDDDDNDDEEDEDNAADNVDSNDRSKLKRSVDDGVTVAKESSDAADNDNDENDADDEEEDDDPDATVELTPSPTAATAAAGKTKVRRKVRKVRDGGKQTPEK